MSLWAGQGDRSVFDGLDGVRFKYLMFLTEIWRGPSLSLNSDTQAPCLGDRGAGS